ESSVGDEQASSCGNRKATTQAPAKSTRNCSFREPLRDDEQRLRVGPVQRQIGEIDDGSEYCSLVQCVAGPYARLPVKAPAPGEPAEVSSTGELRHAEGHVSAAHTRNRRQTPAACSGY